MVSMDVEGLAEPRESAPDAQDLAILNEMSDVLRKAIENLPDAERQIIELAYFKDMSLKEAGEKMGLSRSWACRLHSRAIRLLRGVMGDLE
jgi:RNA polymerase sigma factor (sigma-70 family)